MAKNKTDAVLFLNSKRLLQIGDKFMKMNMIDEKTMKEVPVTFLICPLF